MATNGKVNFYKIVFDEKNKAFCIKDFKNNTIKICSSYSTAIIDLEQFNSKAIDDGVFYQEKIISNNQSNNYYNNQEQYPSGGQSQRRNYSSDIVDIVDFFNWRISQMESNIQEAILDSLQNQAPQSQRRYVGNSRPNYISNREPNYLSHREENPTSNSRPNYMSNREPSLIGYKSPNYLSTREPSRTENSRPNYMSNREPSLIGYKRPNYLSIRETQNTLNRKPLSLNPNVSDVYLELSNENESLRFALEALRGELRSWKNTGSGLNLNDEEIFLKNKQIINKNLDENSKIISKLSRESSASIIEPNNEVEKKIKLQNDKYKETFFKLQDDGSLERYLKDLHKN